MGTIPPENTTPQGYIQRIGHTATILSESVTETAYGHRSASIYPLLLVLLTILCIIIGYPFGGVVTLVLLAVWVGGVR